MPVEGRDPVSYPAAIPRTPPFAAVRQRVDNSMTCRDGSPESAKVRHEHIRNVEVGSSSPLTSTPKVPAQKGLAGSPDKVARSRMAGYDLT